MTTAITHGLSESQLFITAVHDVAQPTLRATEVTDDCDCGPCFFLTRRCPVTSTGCAACTPDVRKDGKTIVWQVAS